MQKWRLFEEQDLRIKSTIAKRLALQVALVGAVLSVLALCVLVPLQRLSLRREAISEAQTLAEAVSGMYRLVNTSQEMRLASQELVQVARAPHVDFVRVMDAHGHVLFSTERGHIGDQVELQEGVRRLESLLIVTRRVPDSTGQITAVSVAMDLAVMYADLYHFYFLVFLGFCVLVAFLALLVAFIAERIIGVRLARLSMVMQSAEKGSFLVRAQQDRMDEIGQLAGQFNQLLAALTSLKAKDIEREQDLHHAQEELAMKAEVERYAKELQSTNQNLKRRVSEQELLMQAAHHLSGTLKKEKVIERLVTLVRDKLGWPDFAVFLMRGDAEHNKHLSLASASGLPDIEVIQSMVFRLGEGITGIVAQTGAPLVVPDLALENRIKLRELIQDQSNLPAFLGQGSMLSVPMIYQGRVIGVMDFFCPDKNAFDEEHMKLLSALGAQAAVALVNADLYEATLELAISDPLTGVMNRRALYQRLESEIARVQRFKAPLTVLMVDVDHFKQYNDTMGHVLGDKALKQIAKSMQSSVRKVDAVARFGGEEFCLILPQTEEKNALEVAHKLCEAIRQLKLPGEEKQPLGFVSISVGIAQYPSDMPKVVEGPEAMALIHQADKALYAAKSSGRNRVVLASTLVNEDL